MSPKTNRSWNLKYIFITGGVASSVGKGLTTASIASLLEERGHKISIIKFDPYINVDPGTMNPFQHGEVYVTEDGAETDLDLGHYERFTNCTMSYQNSVSTGQIYETVIQNERQGKYLGGTVQVIPHITDEIKRRIFKVSKNKEVTLVEIGGTVGDIEGLPFLETIRQVRSSVGAGNSVIVHVTLLPKIDVAGEIKTKPTQHSVRELRSLGLQPDFLVCRSKDIITSSAKEKISLQCSVDIDKIVSSPDVESIYALPIFMHKESLDTNIVKKLKLKSKKPNISKWNNVILDLKKATQKVKIAFIGKYVDLKESYKSLHEAIIHSGIKNRVRIEIRYIDSEKFKENSLKNIDAVIIPGGFGNRGIEGKIAAAKYARENKIPFLGICLGMQLCIIEYAKNICGIKTATSSEFSKTGTHIIHTMKDQKKKINKGGTMRLGSYTCYLSNNTLAKRLYKKIKIKERHRHRYEVNNKYASVLKKHGLVLSGINKEKNLIEMIELKDHPWFIGVQFHPEFKSKPFLPHPLFDGLIKAAISKNK